MSSVIEEDLPVSKSDKSKIETAYLESSLDESSQSPVLPFQRRPTKNWSVKDENPSLVRDDESDVPKQDPKAKPSIENPTTLESGHKKKKKKKSLNVFSNDLLTREKSDNQQEYIPPAFLTDRAPFITMQMVDSQRRELFLQVTLKDIFFYLIFLAFLSFMVLGAFSSSMYYLSKSLTDLLINRQFIDQRGIPSTFEQVTNIYDFFPYFETLVMEVFYEDLAMTRNESKTNNTVLVVTENRVIGVPRLRQVTVKKASCVLGYHYPEMGCFGEYSSDAEGTEPLTIRNPSAPMLEISTRYHAQSKTNSLPYTGKLATYGGGGYYLDFSTTRNKTLEDLRTIKQQLWLYRNTRCVFFDFVVYNANLNLFCVGKLVFEIPLTGGIIPDYSFTTVKLIRYFTSWDYFLKAAEWLCMGFIVYYTLEEAREMWYFRIRYFTQFWNYLDLAICILGFTCIIYGVVLSYKVQRTFDAYLNYEDAYPNFEQVASMQNRFNNMLAILLFLAYIKIFKYLSFNKTFGQLNSTLQRCALDILAFCVMLFIMFASYAELGYLLFGVQVKDFNAIGTAIITLLRTILGDFDYKALQDVHGYLAPLYFLSFIFFVFFVLLNMFLAIINDTYTDVKTEMALAPEEMQMTQFLKRGFFRLMVMCGCKNYASRQEEMENEYLITIEEIRGALKKCGFLDVEISIFFNRYNINTSSEGGTRDINQLLADLDESSVKSSTIDFTGSGQVTIEDYLNQEAKLQVIENQILEITQKVEALLTLLNTIDSARRANKDRHKKKQT